MKRNIVLAIFIIVSNMLVHGQKNVERKPNSHKISIYEYGDSLFSCESNFENLNRNWRKEYITNAKQFKLGKYSFVETITDSARYRYYRNYFSGLEVVNHYWAVTGFSSYDRIGKLWEIENDYFISPFKYKWALLEMLPVCMVEKMLKLYETEINIDTIKIDTVSQRKYKVVREIQEGDISFTNTSKEVDISIWAYSDSATKRSIDSMILIQMPFEKLSLQSQEAIFTTLNLFMRVETQKRFNKTVQIGDRVYLVPFEFGGYKFNVFVICNPISKKVVWDHFFKNILIDVSKDINKST